MHSLALLNSYEISDRGFDGRLRFLISSPIALVQSFLPSAFFNVFWNIFPFFLKDFFIKMSSIWQCYYKIGNQPNSSGGPGHHYILFCPSPCWSSCSSKPSNCLNCPSKGSPNMQNVQARNPINCSFAICQTFCRMDRRGEMWQMFAKVVHDHWKVWQIKYSPNKW